MFFPQFKTNTDLIPWTIKERWLNKGGTYLKKRTVIQMKFESFVIVSFKIIVNDNHNDI